MQTEINEADQIRSQTHELMARLGGAGFPDRIITPSIHFALVERMLLSGGLEKTQAFLRVQADQLDEWGAAYLAEARKLTG